jgi:N-acetylglucosaminyldiphosphoundecaprenol N-acetyl-beta-D-mannosaminyltransferase
MKKQDLFRLNIAIYPGSFSEVTHEILERIRQRSSTIVLPFSLNDLASIRNQKENLRSYRNVDICTTDGMPIVWWFNLHKVRTERVYGPELMKEIITHTQGKQIKHYLLGSSPLVLHLLRNELTKFAPKVNIVGSFSPPYRQLENSDIKAIAKQIKKCRATIVWIGLSSPKQVILAASLKKVLPKTSFFCVGAAFDIVSKTKPMAPKLLQILGLEWLFRVVLEPKRLWKRYCIDIPLCLLQLTFKKITSQQDESHDQSIGR